MVVPIIEASPAAAATCTGQSMYLIAHSDDDLLFQSPDLVHEVQQGWCITTVYTDAGDQGYDTSYWLNRESAAGNAYAQMFGVANSWAQSTTTAAGHSITTFTLNGTQAAVRHLFIRLPDGNFDGTGYTADGRESLLKLWNGSISSIHPLDGAAAYTKQGLSDTLLALMNAFQPTRIHVQDWTLTVGNANDHSDHIVTGYFAHAVHPNYTLNHTITAYIGYDTQYMTQNVSGADLTAKYNAFLAYDAVDDVCNPSCSGTQYDAWLKRQYIRTSETAGGPPPNQPPTANAGPAQTVAPGSTVTLDGSGSTDPNGDAISYQWTQTAGPTVTLSSTTAQRPTFTAPATPTSLTFQLVVNDGQANSTPSSVTITDDRAPVANAGPAQQVLPSTTVTLDGSGSTDPDGDALTYQWTQTAGPTVTLSSTTAQKPTFTAPASATSLTFRLIVNDGRLSSTASTVSITVNRPPTANAGPAQTVGPGALVTLDGSGSSDADGDAITYQWTQTAGPTVTLSSTTAQKPTFTAPASATTLTFRLIVSDGKTTSAPSTVTITVDRVPVANAGPAQTVAPAATVTLDGSASSDPDGDPLTYQWTQTAGPTVTLSSATAQQPTFTAPSTSATLTFRLVVNDGVASSAPSTVTITVDRAPVANAGAGQQVLPSTTVTLDGSGSSDPDGDAITYQWSQTGGPAVTLSSATAQRPTFTAPASASTLTFQLVVNDARLSSTASSVTIIVNRPPVANAGPAQTVTPGGTVMLDGSSSSDPDGDALAYQWTQTAGPAVTLSSSIAARPTFTAPATSTSLTFQLTVSDGKIGSAPSTVTITVDAAPVANAGSGQTVQPSALVTLDGSASTDPDGDPITYQWSQTAGTAVTLSSATARQPTFTAPATGATLTFQLVVNDGRLTSSPSSVTVVVNGPPTADAGPAQTVVPGATVTLDGSASSDPTNDPLTYQWTQTAGPAVTLSSATAQRPTFTAPATSATLTFQLVVNDGSYNSAPSTVTITVDRAPVANAGAGQQVLPATTVTLDASASSDPDGDPLTYLWSQTGGPTVTLSSATAQRPTFTAPASATTLTFRVVVNDGRLSSAPSAVTIVVNRPPTASAGSAQSVAPGAAVTLDGSASSDPDGDPITYSWSQTAGPAVTLSSTTAQRPTFTAPASATTLTFQLVVNDGKTNSTPSTVTITVASVPRGFDVQATSGGSAGQLSSGDRITLTYTTVMNLSTLASGWTGTSRSIGVRLRDGSQLGLTGSDDTLDVFTTTGLTTAVNVGSVDLGGNYVTGKSPVVFDATMVASTATVNGQQATVITITLGTASSGASGLKAVKTGTTMVWTPSAAATDPAGNQCATTPVTETGATDGDF